MLDELKSTLSKLPPWAWIAGGGVIILGLLFARRKTPTVMSDQMPRETGGGGSVTPAPSAPSSPGPDYTSLFSGLTSTLSKLMTNQAALSGSLERIGQSVESSVSGLQTQLASFKAPAPTTDPLRPGQNDIHLPQPTPTTGSGAGGITPTTTPAVKPPPGGFLPIPKFKSNEEMLKDMLQKGQITMDLIEQNAKEQGIPVPPGLTSPAKSGGGGGGGGKAMII